MTAQKRSQDTLPTTSRKPGRRPWSAASPAFVAALLGCLLPAIGCKTGTSLAKPSWWTFGGTAKDADALASAPPYGGGDIKKPSEASKPYPTTSTPSGYVVTGTASGAGTASRQFESVQSSAPVVYGSTPMPQPAAVGMAAAPSAATPQPLASSSIAPQVGPYAALGGDTIPPPGQPLPPLSASALPGSSVSSSMAGMAAMPPSAPNGQGMPSLPSEAALPNTAYSNFSAPATSPAAGEPPARMADSRFANPAAALPAAALPSTAIPADPGVSGGSRYSSSPGSRFSGAEAASFSPPAVAQPAAYGTTPASAFPTMPAPPAPAAMPAAPGLLQPSAQPPAQPVRRPDPLYRPGGTSSYRSSRALLADDADPASAPAESAVRTAAYDEPLAGAVQR